ncbi:MAG: PorT family protein [Saprospiraceae bacterium]|nr:PorT family protein [Saprospiraceae bacterium]
MKNYLKIFICLLLFITVKQSFSQNIKGAILFGTNISQVDGDEVFGFKHYGFNVGASAMMPMGESNWSIVLETTYSQKGAHEKYDPAGIDSVYPYYDLRLDYVEVPVMIQYSDKNVLSFGTGLSWGRLIEFNEVEHGLKVQWDNAYGPYSRSDINWLADLRFRIYERLHFNIRYSYSLAKIRTRTYTPVNLSSFDRRQYNNIITLRFIYIFNEVVPKKRK